MKYMITILLLFIVGCQNKDSKYYEKLYFENKSKFKLLKDTVRSLISNNSKIYKHSVHSGKTFSETTYDTDSTNNIADTCLNFKNRKTVMNLMGKLNIIDFEVSRTNANYYFGQLNYDVIMIFEKDTFLNDAFMLDKRTFLYLNQNTYE